MVIFLAVNFEREEAEADQCQQPGGDRRHPQQLLCHRGRQAACCRLLISRSFMIALASS